MELLKKSEFYKHYNSGVLKLDKDELVLAYPKPTGAVCTVCQQKSTSTLINGEAHFANDDLSKYLTRHGITGSVIIHNLTLSRNVPKWLTYSLSESDWKRWSADIKVYGLGVAPTKSGNIPVETIHPIKVKVSELKQVIDRLSRDPNFDGLIVKSDSLHGVNHYHFVPTRYCTGQIQAVTRHGKYVNDLIVDVPHLGYNFTIKVSQMSKTLKDKLAGMQDELIRGRKVRIQYTSYIPGDRLKNFSAPAALSFTE